MPKGKQNKHREAVKDNLIQREQLELVKAERDILAMLDQIDRQINQLIVEEFQLKSNEVANLTDKKCPRQYYGPIANTPEIGLTHMIKQQPEFELNSDPIPSGFTITSLDNDAMYIDSSQLINQQHLDLDASSVPAGFTITALNTDGEEEYDD